MNEIIGNKKKWELLCEAVVNMNYEDIITHKQIGRIINEPYESKKYFSIITRARKELLKQSKEIESIHGQGYRVLTPDGYVDKSVLSFKSGFKKLQKGTDILQFAPTKDMTKEGLITYRNVSDRARILYASMAGGCTELNLLAKKASVFLPENIARR